MRSDTSSDSLLSLLQLSDSALPIGSFSHSFGLETWIQNSVLKTADDIGSSILALLRYSIAPQQGLACAIARECHVSCDTERFRQLNWQLSASMWAVEPLKASVQMGQRLARLAKDIGWVNEGDIAHKMLSSSELHHVTVFGCIASVKNLEENICIAAYLYNACCGLVSAAVRLLPLGHTDGQRILASLHGEIQNLSNQCMGKTENDIQAFAPMNEWACVQHESLYSRLFQS